MNELLVALIIGVVEGFTEFLPVSSTGHMILVGHLLGFEGEKAHTFEVIIQLGSMLAVLGLYGKRYLSMLNVKTIGRQEKKLDALHIACGILPAAAGGIALHGFIKGTLFNPWVVVVSLVVGAFLLIYAEKTQKKRAVSAPTVDDFTYKQALLVGLFQCLAMFPGFSRAGATISGGLLVGASHKAAAEFSFLVALPLMIGATGLDFAKNLDILTTADIPMFAVGFGTAFVVALVVAVLFINLIEKIGLTVFAYYRILLAAVFALFLIL